MKNKPLRGAIEMLNKVIDQCILKGDWKEYRRLCRLHRQLTNQ